MGEVSSRAGENLELLRLDVSWARRAADFDVRVFGNQPRRCEEARSADEAIPSSTTAMYELEVATPASQARNDGGKTTFHNHVDEAWPFEVWQAMLSNPLNCFYAYVRPAEGMQVHGDIVALGGVSFGDESEILTLGVERAYRNHGLGGKLLDLLIAQAEKNTSATHVTLEVRADKKRALALYESRGFTPCVNRHQSPEKTISKAQLFLIKKL